MSHIRLEYTFIIIKSGLHVTILTTFKIAKFLIVQGIRPNQFVFQWVVAVSDKANNADDIFR